MSGRADHETEKRDVAMSDPIALNEDRVARHRPEALRLKPREVEAGPPRPVKELVGHGRFVARKMRENWASEEGRPGFEVVPRRISAGTPDRIDSLCDALEASNYELLESNSAAHLDEEGIAELLTSLREELSFAAAAPEAGELSVKLRAVENRYGEPGSRLHIAAALMAFGELAERNKALVAEESFRFDAEWIGHAVKAAEALREQASRDAQAIDLRNRMLTLLLIELRNARRVAGYLWRRTLPALWLTFRVLPAARRGAAPAPAQRAAPTPAGRRAAVAG